MSNTTDTSRRGLPLDCLPPDALNETRELIAAGSAVTLVDPNDWEEPPNYPAALIARHGCDFGVCLMFGDVKQPELRDVIREARRAITDQRHWQRVAVSCADQEIVFIDGDPRSSSGLRNAVSEILAGRDSSASVSRPTKKRKGEATCK